MGSDYLVVDKTLVPKNDQVILAQINNDFSIKRFYRHGKKMTLKADNPLFKDVDFDEEQNFIICGVVVSALRTNL